MKTRYTLSSRAGIFFFAFVLLVLGLYLVIPKTTYIDKHLQATVIEKGGSCKNQLTTVKVVGVYNSRVCGKESFDGKIEIEGLTDDSGDMLPIVFDPQDKNYGALTYQRSNRLEFVGYVKMNKDASEIIICLFEDGEAERKIWGPYEGLIILYPYTSISDLDNVIY